MRMRKSKMTVKNCLEECAQGEHSRRKLNILSNINVLLGENCEVEKLMKFL